MEQQQKSNVQKTDFFPCPSCGANMVFSPEAQSLICPYCNSKVDIKNQNTDIMEYDFETAEEESSTDWGNENRVIHCENCGADTVLNENMVAQSCAFCGSSHIVKTDQMSGIAPGSLVPFKVTKKNAETSFLKWIKNRHWAPGKLKSHYQAEKLSGVYIPSWTYDSNTYSYYTAEAGTYYYETVTEWVEENGERKEVTKQVRKTRWEFTSGYYSRFFNDVLVNASKKINENLMTKLEPFYLNELTTYDSRYMSGFLAEKYSVNLKQGWEKSKAVINRNINRDIIKKIGADEVRNLNINTSYNDIKYKHLLLPIWVSSFTYKNKLYQYLINGQTGEIQGQYPKSVPKIVGTIIGGIFALLLLILII